MKMSLTNKIDFAVVFKVKNANPNGDPLNGNRPRTNYNRIGEVSDVCIKRKIRNRLMEVKENDEYKYQIFVQSDDNKLDDCKNLRERAETVIDSKKSSKKNAELACNQWFDVRAFGQVFAYGGEKKGSDTMGMKHRVDKGIYVFYGSMNPQLATKTGFSDEDALAIKNVLPKFFENDASSARPEGSMEVLKVAWWDHNCPHGQYSSAKVHRSLSVNPDGSLDSAKLNSLDGLKPEIIDGF
jgi:CRISPR-associated protein Csd2